MKIGILQTGRALPPIAARHGDFDTLFTQLLADQGFEFETFAVLEDDFPAAVDSCDGWLITGSSHSCYEPLAWITRLEGFLRAAYDREVPIVGICFGHQVLARALGGRVEKYQDGWALGPHDYHFDGIASPVTINAWHQDQVVQLPADGRAVGRSDFCANAAIVYGRRAYTIQAHPEFTNDFIADLIDMRRAAVPADLVAAAEQDLQTQAPSPEVMAQMVSFFRSRSLAILPADPIGAA